MKKILFIFCILLSSFAFADEGDTKYVSVPKVSLYASKSSFSKTVAPVSYGESLVVVKEERKWTFVQNSKGISGWIPSTSLSKKKIVANGSVNLNIDELALAGKGFSEEDETNYKKSGNANYDAVDAMEKNSISKIELKKFLKDGNLTVGDE